MAIKPSKPVVKVNSNPNPTPAKGNKNASFDAHEYDASYQSEVLDPHYGIERTGPDVIKVNSNPNPKPAKGMKGSVDSSLAGRAPQKYDWDANAWNSREVDDEYGNPGYDSKAPIKPIQVHSGGHLGGAHMGGHSDVAAAIRLGGLTMKTPIMKPTSTKQKTPVAKPSSTKNK